MSREDEKEKIYIREEIIKEIEKASLHKLKLIYQFIKTLMA